MKKILIAALAFTLFAACAENSKRNEVSTQDTSTSVVTDTIDTFGNTGDTNDAGRDSVGMQRRYDTMR